MSKEIRILVVEPMKQPVVRYIEHTLPAMQQVVGGLIAATYPWDDEVAVVVDDEGLLKGYMPNRALEDYDILVGTFFICGLSKDNFDSLSDDLLEKYRQKFLWPEMFVRDQDGRILVYRVGSGEAPMPMRH
ncbi:MAG: DUF3846 domain-containing protein [Clostridia bacterium]|nr:DUF3846 domain-containing protein [Clostridia bacterium]